MDKAALHELIEAYLKGQLSGKALQDFEQLMAEDPDIQLEVAIHRDINVFLEEEQEVEAFESILQKEAAAFQSANEALEEERIDRAANRIGWLAVAALVLFGLLYVAYINLQTGPDYDQIFAANFEPAPLTAIDRSTSPSIDSLERLAVLAYQKGEFSSAAVLFNNLILFEEPDKIEWSFYLGVAELSKEPLQVLRAVDALEPVRSAEDHPLQQSGYWYSALAELSLGDVDRAVEYLEKTEALPGKFTAKAKAILKELR
ncbi:MAG: hypothetical protein AAF598_07250 [Bacteroidota bacterium]